MSFTRRASQINDHWAWVIFSGLAIWAVIEGNALAAACWGFIAGSSLHWSDRKRREGAR